MRVLRRVCSRVDACVVACVDSWVSVCVRAYVGTYMCWCFLICVLRVCMCAGVVSCHGACVWV